MTKILKETTASDRVSRSCVQPNTNVFTAWEQEQEKQQEKKVHRHTYVYKTTYINDRTDPYIQNHIYKWSNCPRGLEREKAFDQVYLLSLPVSPSSFLPLTYNKRLLFTRHRSCDFGWLWVFANLRIKFTYPHHCTLFDDRDMYRCAASCIWSVI